jgi:hypothetical protein
VKRFLRRASSERGVDLESWEFGLRQAVLSAGADLLEQLVDGIGSRRRDELVVCECGAQMESHGRRSKVIHTILGKIRFKRSVFVCPSCESRRRPGDEALDVVGTLFSPGLRRLMARAGQRDTFKEGRDDLKEFAGVEVTAKQVERVSEGTGEIVEEWNQVACELALANESIDGSDTEVSLLYISYDGTGVPMVPWETAGRKGKQEDGTSKTREVKLGCVFTQSATDDEGFAVRDDGSTSFVGAIESSDAFGKRIYAEARRRGLDTAEKVVVIADGARYNWEIAALHFPGCIEIVDLYHAREHLHGLCGLLSAKGTKAFHRLELQFRTWLDEGRVEKIIAKAELILPDHEDQRKEAEREIGYFRNNAHRMRYAHFREQGLFVGSGVVEAGCKTVVGKRLKQSGMQWTTRGANAIIALGPFFFAVATAKQSAKERGYSAFILNALNLSFNRQVEKLPGSRWMH